ELTGQQEQGETGKKASHLVPILTCLLPQLSAQNSTVCADCSGWLDLSKMYLSNQEYYLKLEELKNAHLETMAKLEKMYQNKLYLKGVQPLTDTNEAASQTSSNEGDKLIQSFSEPDLNSSFHSYFSDVSDEDLELEENNSEDEWLMFSKQPTKNACDVYSLDDYSHFTKISSKVHISKKIKRKRKKWFPKITVPEPFQMTVREAKKQQQNIKPKSLIELENNLLKKQLEEEAECQKKFRANPVPAHVFVPLYHEIMQQNEERRKSFRERRRKLLLSMQKPFQFLEREAQKNEMKKLQLKDLSSPKKKTKIFKARPVPKFIYSSEINEKLKEKELYRDIRIQMRSEELLRNSSLPNSRLGSRAASKPRQQNCLEQSKELEHKQKIKVMVPDFETLHQKFEKQLQRQKNVKHTTVCEPFNLFTQNIPSNKEKILEDIQMDEEKLKETRWPYASSRCRPQMRSLNARSPPSGYNESTSPRITESTRRRLQAIRESAESKKKVEEDQKRSQVKQKQRARMLQRLIKTRAEAHDPHQSLAQMYKSKLKIFRKHEKQRMKEYLQELEEIEERVKKRPLLLEQTAQKNARVSAEKHYSDILRELGLREEFVSKKGQIAKEMCLQDHSNMEEKSQFQSSHSYEEEEDEEDGDPDVLADHYAFDEKSEESPQEKSSDDEG
uniref:Protein FAM161A n=1 Tax=Salvator merianae TaxID=96440 RepID=A0A8D0BEG2_SALMN